MKAYYSLSQDIEAPYVMQLEAHIDGKFYIVTEINDINNLSESELKRAQQFPGACEAIEVAKNRYADAASKVYTNHHKAN